MTIETHTPELEEHRRSLVKLLAWRYPAEAVSRFPEKEFHRWIREYELEAELHGAPDPQTDAATALEMKHQVMAAQRAKRLPNPRMHAT